MPTVPTGAFAPCPSAARRAAMIANAQTAGMTVATIVTRTVTTAMTIATSAGMTAAPTGGRSSARTGRATRRRACAGATKKAIASPRYDRRYDRREPRWERRTIEDIIFGTPRRDQDRRRATLDQRVLGEVLGRSAVRDLERAATGSLVGRWVQPSRTVRVLQLRDDRGPLAEMTDYNADGRVDLVLVNGQR